MRNRFEFSRSRTFWLTMALVAEVLVIAFLQAPLLRFDRFAIFDSGGELAIQDLIRRGYRPGIDFGYLYGLLPLFVGRLWYRYAGLTAETFHLEVMACMMLSTWGMARLAAYRRLGPAGLAVIALTIPDLLLVTYIGLVQTLEQALLINALAEQARGRRDTALAILTACCFVKPSLAVVQCLAVVIAIVAARRSDGWAACTRSFVPALATAVVLAVVLAMSFGIESLSKTVFPLTGMAVYRLGGFGFFRGIGRDFWVLPHAGVRDYFRYELGFWILGTLFLTSAGLAVLLRSVRTDTVGNRAIDDELCATCAAVHLAFICLIFGHRGTWFYSLPMLAIGLAVLGSRGRWHRTVLWVFVVLLLVSDRSKALDLVNRRKTEAPSPVTLNLWSDSQEQAEWARALELTHATRPVLLAMCEGGALLIPGFDPPVGGYFVPGNALPVEVGRKAAQLAAASMIISTVPSNWPGFAFWPEVKAGLDGCELIMEGRYVRVYRRIAPASIITR